LYVFFFFLFFFFPISLWILHSFLCLVLELVQSDTFLLARISGMLE
jgi:hypothetical protein